MMSSEGLLLVIIIFIIIPLILLLKYPSLRKALGFILIIMGILLSISGIGAIIGIPMIIFGAILFFVGQKKQEHVPVQSQQQQNQNQTINNIIGQTQEKIMIRCPSCGKLNEVNNSFCISCGKNLK